MVPAPTADYVRAPIWPHPEMKNRVERPCVLSSICSRGLKMLPGCGIDGQVVPHEFTVEREVIVEVDSAADDKIAPVVDKGSQVSLRKADAPTYVKEPSALVLSVR